MKMFQVCYHGLLVIFIKGVQTYCGGPNIVDSYPKDFEVQIVQTRWFFHVRVIVYGLSSIICVLLSITKDKNYLHRNLMVR